MSKLADLKKKSAANLKKLQEKLESQSGGSGPRDERIWKPKFNKEKGKGTAIVRFLIPKNGDPFVEVKSYQFNGPGGNYWDLARCTIGEEDPIQIAAINAFRKAKAEGDEQLKTYAKKFLARSTFYANVYVIKDEENPENEGKVMIYEFGRQIFSFIEKLLKPEFDDIEASDPFDYFTGRDFRIRMVGREIPDSKTGNKIVVPNYENAAFAEESAFMDGDEDKIEEIYEKTYDLTEFVNPSKFKSFDEVAARFKEVTGRPYNWLKKDGLEEHIEEQAAAEKLESDGKPESNQSIDDDDVEDNKSSIDISDDADDEDPVAKFRRLAAKK